MAMSSRTAISLPFTTIVAITLKHSSGDTCIGIARKRQVGTVDRLGPAYWADCLNVHTDQMQFAKGTD